MKEKIEKNVYAYISKITNREQDLLKHSIEVHDNEVHFKNKVGAGYFAEYLNKSHIESIDELTGINGHKMYGRKIPLAEITGNSKEKGDAKFYVSQLGEIMLKEYGIKINKQK